MNVTLQIFRGDCKALADKVMNNIPADDYKRLDCIYGIPRGGLPVAFELEKYLPMTIVDNPGSPERTLIVDDLIDSGTILRPFTNHYKAVLYMKPKSPALPRLLSAVLVHQEWIDFWYDNNRSDIQDSIIRLLQFIGEDPTREGLKQTPARVAKMYGEIFSGYKQEPKEILKSVFTDGACNEMVTLSDIEFFSTCEHHLLPFVGKVHIGYIPDGKVVGISKLARLVDLFSRRVQIQEKMTAQIADTLMGEIKPKGVMVVVEAKHLCMMARGVQKQNSIMTTSAIRGVFENIQTRQEFLSLCIKSRSRPH